MHYFLDGYNLLFTLMESKEPLFAQRRTLIQFLQTQFATHCLKGTLVFDGAHRRDEESGLSYEDPLEIAYAPKGQSADAYIVEQIERQANRKQVVVVTNDRGLRLHAQALGATVQGNAPFIQFLRKKSLKKKKGKRGPTVETKGNIERLLIIFEERLKNDPDN